MSWTERPSLAPKHIEERLKLAASGLQAVTITLLAGVVLAPELNTSLTAPLWSKVTAGAIAGVCELAAFKLLAYIPVAKKDPMS
jgi:hypothetical protein